MKLKIGLGIMAFIFFVSTGWCQEGSPQQILEKLEAIQEKQEEILGRLEQMEETLKSIERKQKAYVNPKWAP